MSFGQRIFLVGLAAIAGYAVWNIKGEAAMKTLVSNPEQEIRGLLEFCGLTFEDACLTPEKTERPIRTPSSEQVRQPISADRISYWKHFEENLQPLQKMLGNEITAYEALL